VQVRVLDERAELTIDVQPLAHPHHGEEIPLARELERVPRELAHQAVIEVPELEVSQEVGSLVGQGAMSGVSLLLLLGWTQTRVLRRERRGDDQDIGQAVLGMPGEDHPADARVHRQAGELAADIGQSLAVVNGPEFVQRAQAVGDHARARRVDERESPDVAQAQGLHLEDDRREVRAEDLRRREAFPPPEVFLGIQADADARRGAPAAALALVG